MFTNMKLVIQGGLTVLLLIIVVVYTVFIGERSQMKQIYLIPEGFVRWVEIYYGQKDGRMIDDENHQMVFQIPSSGILRISNKEPIYEWVEVEYYFVDLQGNRNKVLEPNQDFFGKVNRVRNGKIIESFFVGNEQQSKHSEDYPRSYNNQ